MASVNILDEFLQHSSQTTKPLQPKKPEFVFPPAHNKNKTTFESSSF